ncbi:hypothetical protein ACSBR1_037399 [Camellia fascicularis]
MLPLVKLNRYSKLGPKKLALFRTFAFESTCQPKEVEIKRIIKIVNDHPFLDHSLHPTLLEHIPPSVLSTPLVKNVLDRLFAAHSNGLKAFEFFKFSLNTPTSAQVQMLLRRHSIYLHECTTLIKLGN